MDPIADAILALIAAHGTDAVTAAAVRTLPVITFAESNEGIAKYKNENVDLHRLVTNLEAECKRLAQEIKDLEKKLGR
jgi:hypothetical protein